MRVPLPWLAEYAELPPGTTAQQVAADLVRVGLEEEGVHGGGITGPLVVGRVLSFTDEPQKNGKVIRWCSVDTGDAEPRGIVCGAHNFLKDDLVVVVLPGAYLPELGFAITARKTYGHVSDGMICSAKELGLGDDHSGIIRLAELGIDAEPGTDAVGLLGLDEETVEINVTPDRGYALSVRGVAREYGLSTGAAFTDPALVETPATSPDGFPVRIEDDAPLRGRLGCDRYTARIVRGVDPAAPSPRWMRRRLEQAGMRPISLAVDVTNYVMLAVGQPLHAFDLGLMRGAVVVRRAVAGETLTTLDDVERTLHPEDLLITDDDGKRILALAGVMGGAETEVSGATTDVLIEAAHFDAITTARTSRRHRLTTEASRRYERGVDHALAAAGSELAARLLAEYGGGTPGAFTDVDRRTATEPVRMAAGLPSRLVGLPYSAEEVTATLESIGCDVLAEGDVLVVAPPSWRPDLTAGVDLVEEVARLRGYDRIPSVLPVPPAGRGLTHGQRLRRSVTRGLAEQGFAEVLSYPFVSPAVHDRLGLPADDPRRDAVRLANPLSDDQPLMRTSVLSTLLDVVRRNVSRGATDLAVFEVGLVTRPVPGAPAAPIPSVAGRPTAEQLAELDAAVPPQPRRLALVLTGRRELPGWYGPGRDADWSDAVAAALHVARTAGAEPTVVADRDHAPWHPGRTARLELDGTLFGHAGELHPKALAALGLPPRTVAAELDLDVLTAVTGDVRQAVPISAMPLAKEDVALVVAADVPSARVEAALREGAGPLLESVRLFDVYTGPQVGEGNRSLAFALRFRAPDRTLTAEETAAARDGAVAAAASATGAVLRGPGA